MLRLCFEILDIDKDRLLNILELLHLNKNLKPHTLLSREIIVIMDEYLVKNLMNSNKKPRIDINFDGFHKMVTSSCLQSEIRRKFWQLPDTYEAKEPHSICQVLNEDQLAHYYNEDQLADRSFLYENIDYYDDVLPGMRGFGRNVDRLSNQLINFYHSRFSLQAAETMRKIKDNIKRLEVQDLETLKNNGKLPRSQKAKRLHANEQ